MSQSNVCLRVMRMTANGTVIIALEPIRYQGKRIRYHEPTPCIANKERGHKLTINLPPAK